MLGIGRGRFCLVRDLPWFQDPVGMLSWATQVAERWEGNVLCEVSSRAQLWAASGHSRTSSEWEGGWGSRIFGWVFNSDLGQGETSPAQPLADAFFYSALPLLQLGRWRGRLRKLSHPFAEKEQGSKLPFHLWNESKA